MARFKREAVPWPDGLDFGPPPGTPFLAEAVPTAVAVGPDGNWYVSELKGFPFHPGSSRIWRIKRGAEDATCDPEQPNRACRTVETGFTSVIDLAFGDDGELYVLEIAKAGLLAVEEFGAPPIGGLWRVEDGKKKELAPDELMAPGGVAVDDEQHLRHDRHDLRPTGCRCGGPHQGAGRGPRPRRRRRLTRAEPAPRKGRRLPGFRAPPRSGARPRRPPRSTP